MNDDLHRYLDGELPRESLEPGRREEAEAWDRLLDAFRVAETPGGAPPWLEQRVMAEIEALPEPGPFRRAAAWLLRPHPVRVSPLAVGLAAAAVAAVLLVPPDAPAPPGPTDAPSAVRSASDAGGVPPRVYVQFRLEAPGATSVAVAGDFTGWDETYPLEDLDGDGVWTGRVPVRPGVHTYMFVIDGSEWVTDPNAERYTDDGFGNRNAVLAVAAPST